MGLLVIRAVGGNFIFSLFPYYTLEKEGSIELHKLDMVLY